MSFEIGDVLKIVSGGICIIIGFMLILASMAANVYFNVHFLIECEEVCFWKLALQNGSYNISVFNWNLLSLIGDRISLSLFCIFMKWKKLMKLLLKYIKSVEMVTTKLVVMVKMIF